MQSIFKRYEKKYLITEEEKERLQQIFSQYMMPDQYGEYLVQNLYYDTDDWEVIRESIDKPLYKEKMRLRCYGPVASSENFYLELKKKYKGVVYKRRIAIPTQSLKNSSVSSVIGALPSQISKELDFYLQSKAVTEKIYISYQRAAFRGIDNFELRITFDSEVHFRLDDLWFANSSFGRTILPQGMILMEIKSFGGMPLWLARTLSEKEIFSRSFSKVGVCYTDYVCRQICREGKVKTCA